MAREIPLIRELKGMFSATSEIPTLPIRHGGPSQYYCGAAVTASAYRDLGESMLAVYDRRFFDFYHAVEVEINPSTSGFQITGFLEGERDDFQISAISTGSAPTHTRVRQFNSAKVVDIIGRVDVIIDEPFMPEGHIINHTNNHAIGGFGLPANDRVYPGESPENPTPSDFIGGTISVGNTRRAWCQYNHPIKNDVAGGMLPSIELNGSGLQRIVNVDIISYPVQTMPTTIPVFDGPARRYHTATQSAIYLPRPASNAIESPRLVYVNGEPFVYYMALVDYAIYVDGFVVEAESRFRIGHFKFDVTIPSGNGPITHTYSSRNGSTWFANERAYVKTQEALIGEGDPKEYYSTDIIMLHNYENMYLSLIPTAKFTKTPKGGAEWVIKFLQPTDPVVFERANMGKLSEYTGTDYMERRTVEFVSTAPVVGHADKYTMPECSNARVWPMGSYRVYSTTSKIYLFLPTGDGYYYIDIPPDLGTVTEMAVHFGIIVLRTATGYYSLDATFPFWEPPRINFDMRNAEFSFIPCQTHCLGKGGITSKV